MPRSIGRSCCSRLGPFLILFIVGVLEVAAPQIVSGQPSTGRSQLVVEEDTFDFGTVPQGTVVKHDFFLANRGSTEFAIQRVAPSCGCTASAPEKDRVGPGERVPIHVSFDTTGFSGEKIKTVRVFTSDFDRPTVLLTIKGTVLPEVLIEPAQLYFDDAIRGQASTPREVVVRIREGSKSEITGIQSFSPHLKLQDLVSNPRERRFTVSVDPQAPRGELRDRIVVGVRGGTESTINIPVFASVRGALRVRPQTVSFGVLEGTEPLERSIQLDNLGSKGISIVGIQSNNPAVAGTVKTIKPGKNFVVTVRVDPTKVQRDVRAVLEIETDNEEERTVALNVFGILPPRS